MRIEKRDVLCEYQKSFHQIIKGIPKRHDETAPKKVAKNLRIATSPAPFIVDKQLVLRTHRMLKEQRLTEATKRNELKELGTLLQIVLVRRV